MLKSIYLHVVISLLSILTLSIYANSSPPETYELVFSDNTLIKYEWFKQEADQILKKENEIKSWENNILMLKIKNNDIELIKWDRLDRDFYDRWNDKLILLKERYNEMVSEYNQHAIHYSWDSYNKEKLPSYFQPKNI